MVSVFHFLRQAFAVTSTHTTLFHLLPRPWPRQQGSGFPESLPAPHSQDGEWEAHRAKCMPLQSEAYCMQARSTVDKPRQSPMDDSTSRRV